MPLKEWDTRFVRYFEREGGPAFPAPKPIDATFTDVVGALLHNVPAEMSVQDFADSVGENAYLAE